MSRWPEGVPPRVVKVTDWPPLDQALWEEGTRLRGQFEKRRHVDRIKPATVKSAAEGYGRLLAVLAAQDAIDPAAGAADRVTPETLNRFVDALLLLNKPSTIELRLLEIRCAMKIMAPEVDTAWIVRPGGDSLDSWFEQEPRHREVEPMDELHAWGLAMTDRAVSKLPSLSACVAFRNGIIIAVLATCAPRLRSLVGMRDGTHLVTMPGGAYRVLLKEADLKNRDRMVDYVLPGPLSAAMEIYRTKVRPMLLGCQEHDFLWVGNGGRQLRDEGLSRMVRRAMFKRFGKEEGPQYFRHVVTSGIAEALPAHRGLAAAVQAHSLKVSDKVYTHLDGQAAIRRFSKQTLLARDTNRLRAKRLFEQ